MACPAPTRIGSARHRGAWRLAPVLAVGALAAAVAHPYGAAQAAGTTTLTARWTSDAWSASERADLDVTLGGSPRAGTVLTADVTGLRLDAVPTGCRASSTTVRHSWISADGHHLACALEASGSDVTLRLTGVAAAAGEQAGATVTVDGLVATAPSRTTPTTDDRPQRLARIVSSPDFLNSDVGDLRDGPNRWTPDRSSNATDRSYETSLDRVLDDWASLDPDAVLVAGDLVEGRWGEDTERTGTFGPVRTTRQKAAAVRRAAATFYPQWKQRFEQRGLAVYPAIGDHEIGDNPWPKAKRVLVDRYKSQFAKYVTRGRFPDHPRGSNASGTAYAFRPVPQVQVVSVDVFDAGPRRVRVGLDRRQARWLRAVLDRAEADGVEWTIVQGHTPVLEPTRSRGSSRLHVGGGASSSLWRILREHDVDLYLNGEVHDVTLSPDPVAGGPTQLSHGGLFSFGLTTYALIDVYADHLDIDLRDYSVRVERHGARLWETRAPGIPRVVDVDPTPYTIGTARLDSGGLASTTGILVPGAGTDQVRR